MVLGLACKHWFLANWQSALILQTYSCSNRSSIFLRLDLVNGLFRLLYLNVGLLGLHLFLLSLLLVSAAWQGPVSSRQNGNKIKFIALNYRFSVLTCETLSPVTSSGLHFIPDPWDACLFHITIGITETSYLFQSTAITIPLISSIACFPWYFCSSGSWSVLVIPNVSFILGLIVKLKNNDDNYKTIHRQEQQCSTQCVHVIQEIILRSSASVFICSNSIL